MAWFYLVAAGVFEVGFTTCLKLSDHFSDWRWSLGFGVFAFISFSLLSEAAKIIPLGTAYAVWTGIGAFGTALAGIVWFKDPLTFWRLFFLCLLVTSIIGLKLVSTH
jgi:quaternary ammonium compound-resistance protein SugE